MNESAAVMPVGNEHKLSLCVFLAVFPSPSGRKTTLKNLLWNYIIQHCFSDWSLLPPWNQHLSLDLIYQVRTMN